MVLTCAALCRYCLEAGGTAVCAEIRKQEAAEPHGAFLPGRCMTPVWTLQKRAVLTRYANEFSSVSPDTSGGQTRSRRRTEVKEVTACVKSTECPCGLCSASARISQPSRPRNGAAETGGEAPDTPAPAAMGSQQSHQLGRARAPDRATCQASDGAPDRRCGNSSQTGHLFALPVECNFSGAKYDLSVVAHIRAGSHAQASTARYDPAPFTLYRWTVDVTEVYQHAVIVKSSGPCRAYLGFRNSCIRCRKLCECTCKRHSCLACLPS